MAAAFMSMGIASWAKAAPCPGGPCVFVASVDHTSPLGTRWRFDIENCPCQGLRFVKVHFTPKGGVERRVLADASVAQIHVPYDTGSPRFRDVTASTGLGAGNLVLSPQECEGALYAGGRVCVEIRGRGYAWKQSTGYMMGEEIAVWSSSQIGLYNYINEWVFEDDGVIEPRVGLSGQLQIFGDDASYLPYGWRINAQASPTPHVGINHFHNIYYRLDFDIGDANNDAFDRIAYAPSLASSPDGSCESAGECGTTTFTRLTTETNDFVVADEFTSFHVFDKVLKNADGRAVGYEIVPGSRGVWTGMVDTGEPWSSGELWVTRFKQCERFAFDNEIPFLPVGCAGAAQDLTAMVADGQPTDGADIVVWFVNRIRHLVRDEDGPRMPMEWAHFQIVPRGFFYQSPLD